MTAEPVPLPGLAPLQRVMLGDSLAAPGAGHHVEQVEIVLTRSLTGAAVAAAWEETVARTAVLRTTFRIAGGTPVGMESVEPVKLLDLAQPVPTSTGSWLESDRLRLLLAPNEVPWRAVYWPATRRFIWTLHHALLDGRSIARILRGFLARLNGGNADDLAISKWRGPSPETIARANRMFLESTRVPEPAGVELPPLQDGSAVRSLGIDFATRLDALATAMQVTAATILTWAWGQALAEATGSDAVRVEQVRAGAPQHGTAGFTMNTLPVVIHRAADGEVEKSLRELRVQLLAQREIEAVSPDDFPPGVFPNMDEPGSSVIMIERGTLEHLVGATDLVESLVLHEAKGETLMATAYLLPDVRMEVEGPGRHLLLETWIGVLYRLEQARFALLPELAGVERVIVPAGGE
ncbi:MAG: hypothetical protein V4819_22765 [Verrucomicrobiota bacterium]